MKKKTKIFYGDAPTVQREMSLWMENKDISLDHVSFKTADVERYICLYVFIIYTE